jgi:hypothetical protein
MLIPNVSAIVKHITIIMQSCLPLRFCRIAFARPELSGYKVSSKSAE